jgi:hypothetical protein
MILDLGRKTKHKIWELEIARRLGEVISCMEGFEIRNFVAMNRLLGSGRSQSEPWT